LKKHRIILSTMLLVLAFGTVASQSAQNAPTAADKLGRHASMVGLVRTINTLEVTETSQYGSGKSKSVTWFLVFDFTDFGVYQTYGD
jgi:hypothetical protein